LFDLQCNGSADKEGEFGAASQKRARERREGFSCPNVFACHKNSGVESTACSTQQGSQSSPKPRTKGYAVTIASYRVCRVLGRQNEPFGDRDIFKEVFLEAANSLFEHLKIKHGS